MAVSLLDVLFTVRTERSSPPTARLYSSGALLVSTLIVTGLAGRRAKRRR
jgi:hypothetical protein